MIETGSPLAAYHRVLSQNNDILSRSKCIPLHVLQRSWMTFARLLNVDYVTAFKCNECGDQPETIICDATCIGIRKDFLPMFSPGIDSSTEFKVEGSNHRDRVMIKTPKVRNTILDLCKDGLNCDAFQSVLEELTLEGNDALVNVLTKFSKTDDSNGMVSLPKVYNEFIGELCKNSPVSSLCQDVSNLRSYS